MSEDLKDRLAPTRGTTRCQRNYAVTGVEVRAPAEGEEGRTGFRGHASVTGIPYEMYGGPGSAMGGWNETVDPGAFRKTLRENPDVAFLVNHGGLTMARTKAGTLRLAEDDIGLDVNADLDGRRSDVRDVVLGLEGGELDEMSFAFRVTRQVWLTEDGDEVHWSDLSGIDRHIQEVDIHKGDVSVVNYGANPYTDASLRSLAEAVRSLTDTDPNEVRAVIASLETLLAEERAEPEVPAETLELLARCVGRRYAA